MCCYVMTSLQGRVCLHHAVVYDANPLITHVSQNLLRLSLKAFDRSLKLYLSPCGNRSTQLNVEATVDNERHREVKTMEDI